MENGEEIEFEIFRTETKVKFFKAKSLEDAIEKAKKFDWTNKNIASVEYGDTGYEE